MQITPRPLDLDSLYEHGFDAVLLERNHFQALMSAVAETVWMPDPDGVFNAVPSWRSRPSLSDPQASKATHEQVANASSLSCAPVPLLNASNALLESDFLVGSWRRGFDLALRYVSLWDGAEPLEWHWDGPATAGFFMLIYLNDRPGWNDAQGGQLSTGIRSLKGNYLRTEDTPVKQLATIAPSQRTLVCCNNQNPRFVHKVNGLTGPYERKVLMLGFDALATLKGDRKP